MDFKSLRSDKLKLTQEEFANLYGISIQEVQELDKTGKPDMDLIVKIATKSGLDFNTILSYEKPRVKPISAKDTWEKTNFTKKSLSGYLNSALEQMDIPDDMRKNYIDDLEIGIMSKFVKPTVAIVGRSDTGKSTLINSLIGAEKMPAKWTPTTSTAVYVKHIKDRPAFIHDEAWIFKRECGNEKFWNSKRLYDEKYCEKWKVAGGDLSLLETYSTRQGGGLKTEAGIYSKCKEGKKINEFTVDDWKDIGIDTAKAAAEGGISGFAIYSITNFTSISAGPAAAGVSLAFSVSELAYRKSTGAISDEEFKESCQMAALNAAVSAVGAAIGQELIPIPLLGAWIGSFIATQGLERLCDEGFHNALTMSAYEVRKMTQRLEYGTARIAYSSAYTNQAISQAQTLHEETQTLLDDFNRKKR